MCVTHLAPQSVLSNEREILGVWRIALPWECGVSPVPTLLWRVALSAARKWCVTHLAAQNGLSNEREIVGVRRVDRPWECGVSPVLALLWCVTLSATVTTSAALPHRLPEFTLAALPQCLTGYPKGANAIQRAHC